MKKIIENLPENKTVKIEKNEKIINIVERTLYFNQLDNYCILCTDQKNLQSNSL